MDNSMGDFIERLPVVGEHRLHPPTYPNNESWTHAAANSFNCAAKPK
jgi:hypothetical protein